MPVRYECAYFDPISNYIVHTLLETHEFHSWTVSCLVSLFNEKWKYSTCYVFLSKINYCTGPDFAQNTDIEYPKTSNRQGLHSKLVANRIEQCFVANIAHSTLSTIMFSIVTMTNVSNTGSKTLFKPAIQQAQSFRLCTVRRL